MKFLEYSGIEAINSALVFDTPECRVYGRVEPYSCKAAGADKKLYKQIENRYDQSNSPPDNEDGSAGSFRNIISPGVKPEQFRKEPSVSMVINSINATLLNHGKEKVVKDLQIWDSIDALIQLEDSDVYSYNPESDSDPNDEEGAGTLWSFNYFFFNRKLKRIIYVTMRGVSHGAPSEEGEDDFSDASDDENGVGHRRRGMRYDDYVAGEMDML
ncbi:RNA polymerase III-inhibiting protein maf1 [Mortierella antarctica]|nr:RNA polymerase III-inhibiting protein maf1 [Mortierella antarctica]